MYPGRPPDTYLYKVDIHIECTESSIIATGKLPWKLHYDSVDVDRRQVIEALQCQYKALE